MRYIKAGPYKEATDPDEVFKYVTKSGTEYILMCLHNGRHEGTLPCRGCVFSITGNHPLGYESCLTNGLDCTHKLFKELNTILEDL